MFRLINFVIAYFCSFIKFFLRKIMNAKYYMFFLINSNIIESSTFSDLLKEFQHLSYLKLQKM